MMETHSSPCDKNRTSHEERRLNIDELDEWRTHVKEKPKVHDESKQHHDKRRDETMQFKVGDKVLLMKRTPELLLSSTIQTEQSPSWYSKPSHMAVGSPQAGDTGMAMALLKQDKHFSKGRMTHGLRQIAMAVRDGRVHHTVKGHERVRDHEEVHLADLVRALLITAPWDRFFDIIKSTYLEFTLELGSTFQLQTVMVEYEDPGTVQFHLDGLIYLQPATDIYNPSHSKASALARALRYLHALLAHTLTRRRESTGVINTHDAYFLWSMRQGHIFDLAYFVALAFRHQTERHRKGVISISPYGIQSMLHMRIIERRRGFNPPQYRLARAIDKDDTEDILDNIPAF
ncbi:hypothetical protein GOBAR_AA38410 [Gossypium barbadense]|uniref:Uncharacterized protein n=1 Tax=Gossypium barbadense TaxID=3634 RepID=A0A2P5VU04_GOSBA|nr:hypothetical protein GOBAR_AA38410 [Gossypium barbadense]